MQASNVPATSDPSPLLAPLHVLRRGLVPYEEALVEQRRLHAARVADQIPDTLILLEHPHVYTLGRNSDPAHILVDEETLRDQAATVARIERGGEVTYHGPGQLVAYPIFKLASHERSIAELVWRLEETIIRAVAAWGVTARRDPSDRGVWVGSGKIASIGMSLRRWVVLHGTALNVTPTMSYFDYINPCGHPGMRMTSLAQELGYPVEVSEVADMFATQFCAAFGRTTRQ